MHRVSFLQQLFSRLIVHVQGGAPLAGGYGGSRPYVSIDQRILLLRDCAARVLTMLPMHGGRLLEQLPKERLVPAFLQKDFDIITNRYKQEHAEKKKRDYELNLLEATAKHRTRNRFNPISQS